MPAPRVIGVIFPVLPAHAKRFLADRKKVFVKFVPREYKHLRSGSKLFFYESRGNKSVVGEAEIAVITSATPAEVVSKYRRDLFLTSIELEKYVGDRKAKKMLVLVLKRTRKYAVPLRLNRSVTMAGQYMTRTMYEELTGK